MKTCSKCGVSREDGDFYTSRCVKGPGRAAFAACKTCTILMGLKSKAKKAGLTFKLLAEDVPNAPRCPAMGTELVRGAGVGGRGFSPNAPNVDKIRPVNGYVPGNVLTISGRANRLKSDADSTELFRVAVYAYFAERLAGGDPHERQAQVTALVDAVFADNRGIEFYLGLTAPSRSS